MNRRLENLFSHLPERVAQVAVSQGNAATVYEIGNCVVAAACIGCALILLRMSTQGLASTTTRITEGR